MKTPILMHIPEPCHENWDAMTNADKGRHCQSCNKIVVDFSVMSDRQVLDYFKTTTGKTCGRFHDDQLQRPLIEPQQKSTKWNYFIASILGFIMTGKLAAQDRTIKGKVVGKPAVHRNITKGETVAPRESVGAITIIDSVKTVGDTVVKKEPLVNIAMGSVRRTVFTGTEAIINNGKIIGKVIDEKNKPIGGATIILKGTRLGTSSGVDGVFEIKKLGENNKLTLTISCIGFETKEIEVVPKDLKGDLNIVLKTDTKPNADLSSIVFPHQHAYSSCSFLGNVVDQRNNPIPNTTICVKHMKLNTIGDANGMFKFEDLRVPLKIILVISSIGYETKEIEIEPRKIKDNLKIVLEEKKNDLEEVILIVPHTYSKGKYTMGGMSSVTHKQFGSTIKDTVIKKAQQIFNKESIKIYPNPATKNDIIHITIKDAGEYALHFFDTQSRLLTVKNILTNTNNQTTEFQLPSTVATGTYFIRILNEKTQKQVTEKIIVQ